MKLLSTSKKFNIIVPSLAGLWLSLMIMQRSNALDPTCKVIKLDSPEEKWVLCNLTSHQQKLQTDLDENIDGLQFMGSPATTYQEISADAPLKIPRLKYWNVEQVNLRVPKNYFSLLSNPKQIRMVRVNFASDSLPELPPSLTNLHIEGSSFTPMLDLSKLNNLISLRYLDSVLIEVPKVPSTAPLMHLNLDFNPLSNLTLPDIAQYCKLEYITLTDTNIQEGSHMAYCELRAWFMSHKISYKLSVTIRNEFYDENKKTCTDTIPENTEALREYNECLASKSNPWIYFVVIGVGILALIAVVFCFSDALVTRARNQNG